MSWRWCNCIIGQKQKWRANIIQRTALHWADSTILRSALTYSDNSAKCNTISLSCTFLHSDVWYKDVCGTSQYTNRFDSVVQMVSVRYTGAWCNSVWDGMGLVPISIVQMTDRFDTNQSGTWGCATNGYVTIYCGTDGYSSVMQCSEALTRGRLRIELECAN